jgi:hypothetical protein
MTPVGFLASPVRSSARHTTPNVSSCHCIQVIAFLICSDPKKTLQSCKHSRTDITTLCFIGRQYVKWKASSCHRIKGLAYVIPSIRKKCCGHTDTHALSFFVNSPCDYARDIKHWKLLNVTTLKACIILNTSCNRLVSCFLALSPQIGYKPLTKRSGGEKKWFSSLPPSSLLSRSQTSRYSVAYWVSNYVATWSQICSI